MHFKVLIIVPRQQCLASPVGNGGVEAIQKHVARVMHLYNDNNDTKSDDAFWDFYVIGGRWNGFLTGVKQCISDDYHHNVENNTITIATLQDMYTAGTEDTKQMLRAHKVIDCEGKLHPLARRSLDENKTDTASASASTRHATDEEILLKAFARIDSVTDSFSSDEFEALLAKHKDDYILSVDCHC
jgi:hypothetical protein